MGGDCPGRPGEGQSQRSTHAFTIGERAARIRPGGLS